MTDGTDCRNAINLNRYIENFTCSNPEVTHKILKDMRMAFPSANSSFSFYTMLFCAVSVVFLSWNVEVVRWNNWNPTDLPANANELERVSALERLSSICIANVGLVYLVKPSLRLQASLWVNSRCSMNGSWCFHFTGSDVLAGALLGIFFAILNYWILYRDKKRERSALPCTKYELSSKEITVHDS